MRSLYMIFSRAMLSIAAAFLTVLCLAFNRTESVMALSSEGPKPTGGQLVSKCALEQSLRDSIVNYGLDLIGIPYVSQGCSKNGFDCSGFVYYVFRHFKIEVPRSSSQYQFFGNEIPVDSVRKGDILVFLSPTRREIGHVGIVSRPEGNKSEFIHASSGRQMRVIVSSLAQENYQRRFVKAVNVISN